jgi:hypothetical protein
VPALLYGFFACYAVTGKCELRTDSQGRDLAVFTSLEDCQRFGSGPAQQRPNSEGKWLIGDGHYYQCLSMTPNSAPTETASAASVAPAASAAPSTTAQPAVAAASAAAMAGALAAKSASLGVPATPVPGPVAAAPATAAKPAPTTAPDAAAMAATAIPAAAAASTASTAPAAAAVAAPQRDASRPVYRTTAEALQHDFELNPEALNRKIGNAVVEVTGTVADRAKVTDGELLLSGRSSDVTAWLTNDGITGAQVLSKHAYVTLSCDRIGTLVAASGRRPGIVEVRDCRVIHGG